MKAGLGLRLEGFFLVFGIEGDYRFARARATLILAKRQKNFLGDAANRQRGHVIWQTIASFIWRCLVYYSLEERFGADRRMIEHFLQALWGETVSRAFSRPK
jgi:hypothetical protein